jgi:hypothetical protein
MKKNIITVFCALVTLFSCTDSKEKDEPLGYGGIQGFVYIEGTNDPYPNLTIILSDGNITIASTTTDANGLYSFNGIQVGNYTLSVYESSVFLGSRGVSVVPNNSILVTFAFVSTKPDLPDVAVADISTESSWNYWVVGKDEYFFIDEERSMPKFVLYYNLENNIDYGIFFDANGLPDKVITNNWIFVFRNFNGNKVDLSVISPFGEIQRIIEVEINYIWPSAFSSLKSTQTKAGFIRATSRIVAAIPCVVSGAAALTTGGLVIPLDLIAGWTCGNYFFSMANNFSEDAGISNGFTDFYDTYSFTKTSIECTIGSPSCLSSIGARGLEEYANNVEELENRNLEVDRAVNFLNKKIIVIQPGQGDGKDALIGSKTESCIKVEYSFINYNFYLIERELWDECANHISQLYLEFPLFQIPGKSYIQSATLELYGNGLNHMTDSYILSLYRIGNPWQESTITVKNAPIGEFIESKTYTNGTLVIPFTWDITLDTQEWVDLGNNYGLSIVVDSPSHPYFYTDVECSIYGSHCPTVERRPKLTVVYYPWEY